MISNTPVLFFASQVIFSILTILKTLNWENIGLSAAKTSSFITSSDSLQIGCLNLMLWCPRSRYKLPNFYSFVCNVRYPTPNSEAIIFAVASPSSLFLVHSICIIVNTTAKTKYTSQLFLPHTQLMWSVDYCGHRHKFHTYKQNPIS